MKLKLFTILFIVFALVPNVAFSQRAFYPVENYIGVNVGETGAMVNFYPSVAQTYILGYKAGLIYRHVGQKNLGLQVELNLTQRGWKENPATYAKQLDYIELPFLTHFNFGNKFRFFWNIGPEISYLLSEKVLYNSVTNSTAGEQITNIQNPFDYGFCTGIGFLYNLHGQVFQIEARANYMMTDIFSNDMTHYFDTSNSMYASVNFAWLVQFKQY